MNTSDPTNPDQWKEWLEEFRSETDRGCTLLGGAFLDEQLRLLLEGFLVEDQKLCEKLFNGFGPLSSFSARISVCYGLGFLSPEEFRDLELIRKIRNEFAHELHGLSFSSSTIAQRCQELKTCNFSIPDSHKLDLRSRFVISVVMLANYLAIRRLGIGDTRCKKHEGVHHAETISV